MKRFPNLPLFLVLAAAVLLAGCLNLKPARNSTRYFVLSPLPASPGAGTKSTIPGLGLGPVRTPEYLARTSMAVRQSPTEVTYLENALWAERLDLGCQRVLAANLAALLSADQVYLSAWRPRQVACEVQIALSHFDVDLAGQAVLVAQWRILSPGGATLLKAGDCRLTKTGRPLAEGPQGAAAVLSELLGDLSREVAEAVKANIQLPKN